MRQVNRLKRRRVGPVFGGDFHDHVVLVGGAVNSRHLALAKGVVQGLVNRRHADPEPRRCVAVDRHIGRKAVVLLVGIEVFELRQFMQRRQHLGHPHVEAALVVGSQRVLVLRGALAPAHGDVLHRLQE